MTSRNEQYTEVEAALVEAFSRDERVLAVYLHGSFGTKNFRNDSDIDCALLLYPNIVITPVDLMQRTGELSGSLGISLDVGIMTTRNLVYFVEAVQHGQRIFCRDAILTNKRIAHAFSLYAQLREDRKEVEEAYHAA